MINYEQLYFKFQLKQKSKQKKEAHKGASKGEPLLWHKDLKR